MGRICVVCEEPMIEGFLVEETSETFCGRECSRSYFSSVEWEKWLEEGRIFWTTWEEKED